jgi:hypothetical protein
VENMYKAYEKTIDGKTFYFIKQFLAFPEYKNVPPVLTAYGMHTDFNKACGIAMIYDKAIKNKLSKEQGFQEHLPAFLPGESRAIVYNFKWKAMPLHSMWRLIRSWS